MKQTIEMQAIIEGTAKKHSWMAQNEQEHRDEVNRLREQNTTLADQLMSTKEELMKFKLNCEHMESDLQQKMQEVCCYC